MISAVAGSVGEAIGCTFLSFAVAFARCECGPSAFSVSRV
jgi:hypothetical protein